MGVKGLTSFIARNADQYMSPFQLHDCDLVIDGDNLACNLYKTYSNCNSAFGGDYDEYYRTVLKFFKLLASCNIRSFVLLDGGYEKKKLRTVQTRLRAKIGAIKHIDPSNGGSMFPLMMREVFVDAMRDSGVRFMRCLLEADEELAVLAKCLNCPVLSFDSDFYIFNVKYIPLVTLNMKVLERRENKTNHQEERALRKCEARNVKKKHNLNSNKTIKIEDEVNKTKKMKGKTIKYLDCCLYKIENLLEKAKLDKEKLPLFAALLGNDYINVKMFNKFYSQVGKKGINKNIPKHQKRVIVIIKWLRHESKQSALEKILARMKKHQREYLLREIQFATGGYLTEKCISFNYFNLTDNDRAEDLNEIDDEESDSSEIEILDENLNILDEVTDSEEEDEDSDKTSENEENLFSADEDSGDHSEIEILVESCDVLEETENKEENQEKTSENEEKLLTTDKTPAENQDQISELTEKLKETTLSHSEELNISNENYVESKEQQKSQIAVELLQKIYAAELPRYVNDLVNLNLYLNNPQIENFLFPDCNEIAIPILFKIFAYLHYPNKPELSYLTRVTRLTNCKYKKYPIEDIPIEYDNMLQDILWASKLNINDLQSDINEFVPDIQFYLIILFYWARKSEYCNNFHIHSLLICLVTIRFIDFRVEPIRNEKQFHKTHGKKVHKEKQLKAKDTESTENSKDQKAKDILNKLTIHERIECIPKIEIILLQENLLKYFSSAEYRKQHTSFSSTIIHGFSEFQSVIYQMYTLNALLNYPFHQIKIENLFSGLFLYNIYTNLQNRIDIQYHIKNYIFRDSEIPYQYYCYLGKLCEKYIASFKMSEDINNTNINKKIKKKISQKNKKNKLAGADIVENVSDMIVNEDESCDFTTSLNNKFGALNVS